MRHIYIIFLLFFSFSFSQVSVSRSHRGLFKDLKKEDYKEIKKRKTIFVIDSFDEIKFEEMLKTFWDLNKYEVLSREKYEENKEKYISEDYSIFEFSGLLVTITSQSGMTTEYLYLNYNYFYYTDVKVNNGKIKFDKTEVASVFFSGDADSMWNIISTLKYGNLQNQLYNYQLGYMKNYLQFIQKNLKDDWYSWTFASDYDKKVVKKLSKTTLYIPSYINTKYNGWDGTDTEREDPNELFKKYEYKYEWISNEDLNNKILNTKEDFYYLMYTKINSSKLVSVVNGKTGEIIYRDYQSMSYQLKQKDLKEINNKID
ncbi:hypothetical protein [Flavobacterium sp.]|jgi:hypothetical protein|uniref:hypothetical protein n=1 Tax=Flavobacterium sp. TaxID=239 RepID=UPI002A7F9177|nr:hypothetical protein [Flavobacterium sp.]